MTSWTSYTRPKQQITYREGYYQEVPLGTYIHKDKPATVVSAYYEMKSKYPVSEYRKWVRTFLEEFPCHLVFFTEEDLLPFLQEARKAYADRTRFIVVPRVEWRATTAFPSDFWEKQAALDPEQTIHSPELYKVWYEKKEFVRRAITINPFGHTDFVWTDAGIFRNSALVSAISKHYPNASRIPIDRILLFNSFPFQPSDDRVHEFSNGVKIKFPNDKPRIGGGCIAGSIEAWKWWCDAYDETLSRFITANLFVGKDQTLMASLVLENKEKVALWDMRKVAPDPWWFLTLYLGCSDTIYRFLRSRLARERPRMSYEQLQ